MAGHGPLKKIETENLTRIKQACQVTGRREEMNAFSNKLLWFLPCLPPQIQSALKKVAVWMI